MSLVSDGVYSSIEFFVIMQERFINNMEGATETKFV
jgi:hypothetical protein